MPELPEVETVRRGLEPHIVGKLITRVEQRRPDLRIPFPDNFASRLVGRRIKSLTRRAKYLLAELDSGELLIMHLGMSGSFRVLDGTPGAFHHAREKDPSHDHLEIELQAGACLIYNDPRRFGSVELIRKDALVGHKAFKKLGPEPLNDAFTAAALCRQLVGKSTPVKSALLDQRVVAGLGNIYVCEALFRAQISPVRPAGSLVRKDGAPRKAATLLVDAIRDVLIEAIEAGGSSLRDHRQTDGSLGYFQHSFRVYDREGAECPTPGCSGLIRRILQAGRSTFYCARCQS